MAGISAISNVLTNVTIGKGNYQPVAWSLVPRDAMLDMREVEGYRQAQTTLIATVSLRLRMQPAPLEQPRVGLVDLPAADRSNKMRQQDVLFAIRILRACERDSLPGRPKAMLTNAIARLRTQLTSKQPAVREWNSELKAHPARPGKYWERTGKYGQARLMKQSA